MMGMELPPGHRFNPFEHELITFYLKPKILGQKLQSNVVEEKQLYGPNTNPWQIFHPQTHPWISSEVSVGKFEKIAYVFVNLTKKAVKKINFNGGRKQYIKKAGCGTWDGQTKRTQIRDFNGNLIGERRMLVFEINEVSGLEEDFSRLGHWRMHEYNLCGLNKDIPNPANTVLCKIILDSSKSPAIKLHPNKTIHPKQPPKNNKEGVSENSVTTNVPSPSIGNSVVLDTHLEEGVLENSVTANVCSPSVGNSDVLDTHLEEGVLENSVTTPSCCDGGLVSIDPYRPIGEEDWCYEIDEDWINSIFVSDQGEGGNLHLNMTEFECPSYPEQPVADFTTNLGKRKLHVDTSYAMTEYSPLLEIEEGAVLQEAGVFNDTHPEPGRCLQVRDRATLYLNTLGGDGVVVETDKYVKEFLFGSLDVPLINLETSLQNYEPSEEPFDVNSVPKDKELRSQQLAEKKEAGKSPLVRVLLLLLPHPWLILLKSYYPLSQSSHIL